ncbi:PTS sugar transporter subunit IIA [Lactobacillus sp. R2/2]|nr:PTS sugar transporter subunit IIA [Lactobacillus sp. R2/2]MEB3365376.1 PTS sugar transporter subunit IIA [Lactobacillus sp. R2/2]
MENITSVLDPKVIKIGLNAKNKHEVIVQLAELLKKANYIDKVDPFVKDIYLREKEGLTELVKA